MTKEKVLEELNRLSLEDRLSILESAIHNLREDVQDLHKPKDLRGTKKKLLDGAKQLVKDYSEDKELTALTALDLEDFQDLENYTTERSML